jgi:hypothetical protein
MSHHEREGFQLEDVTVVSEPEGSYVVFNNGAVVANLATDERPGVTFGGLLHGAADELNLSHAFGVDQVNVTGVEGEDGGNRRREVWSFSRPIRWNPETHAVRYVRGSQQIVREVIERAKSKASELQRARSGRPPASPRG